tara:strand:- start:682 stop:1962 length:1281 start_codon:yes stop_codon:yes gene_type:complete
MSQLSGKESKLFKLFHSKFKYGMPTQKEFKKFVTQQLSLPTSMSNEFYMLFFLNYQEDGDYSDVTINRDKTPIVTILEKISEGELDEGDIPSLFYEEPISFCKYGSWRDSDLPCVEFSSNEVTLKLNRSEWEEQNISGLHEEDLWKYYEATSSYGSDHYEEYDIDEFNYFAFDDETIEHIETIAISANRADIVNYITTTPEMSSEILAKYLEDLIPEKDFDSIRQDYLYDIGYETSRVRNIATEEQYKEEIKYDINREYEIEIPMDEFIEMVKEQKPTTFADFLDMEINPEVDLESGYYDTGYYDSEGYTDHIHSLNINLKTLSEKFSDGKLVKYHDSLKEFRKLLETMGIIENGSKSRQGTRYQSKNGRLEFFDRDIDILGKKIKFTYDGVDHKIPMDELLHWGQGSVLDLKESIKKILRKELLK